MSVETTNTIVVGAGQAGVAMSEHLGQAGIDHLVLERIAPRAIQFAAGTTVDPVLLEVFTAKGVGTMVRRDDYV